MAVFSSSLTLANFLGVIFMVCRVGITLQGLLFDRLVVYRPGTLGSITTGVVIPGDPTGPGPQVSVIAIWVLLLYHQDLCLTLPTSSFLQLGYLWKF